MNLNLLPDARYEMLLSSPAQRRPLLELLVSLEYIDTVRAHGLEAVLEDEHTTHIYLYGKREGKFSIITRDCMKFNQQSNNYSYTTTTTAAALIQLLTNSNVQLPPRLSKLQ